MVIKELDKQKILEAFENGDGLGLDEIQYQLNNISNIDNEVNNLIDFLYDLNYLLLKTEQENYIAKYNTRVQEIYSEMKADLFERLEIKERNNAICQVEKITKKEKK